MKKVRNTPKKVKLDKKQAILVIVAIMASFMILSFVIYMMLNSNRESLAVSETVDKTYEKKDIPQITIEEIIDTNQQKTVREEMQTEEIDLEYTTVYQNNDELAKGKVQVLQEGRDGRQRVVTKKTYEGDTLIKEEQTSSVIIKASITKIVEVGTGKTSSKHTVKKGDTLYVTSYTLNMMLEADKESSKITTLQKGNTVTVVEVGKQWCQVKYHHYIGWVDANCLTDRNETQEEQTPSTAGEKSKSTLVASLSKTMNLNKPSGLSLNQFKKVLSGNTNDINKVMEQNAEYFYYIEKQYNINGIFVAAVGIHESNWGTSKIATNKKNLFGYGASDDSPYDKAYSFSNYSEGIDLIARVFVKYYLNPAGTKIYDGQVASGKYYSGPTLGSVNKRYASDKNWSEGVYKQMQYLYNKL